MEIKTSIGGQCFYKQGILEDGTRTGRVQYTGQSPEQLEKELLETIASGRDDVKSFVDGLGLKLQEREKDGH